MFDLTVTPAPLSQPTPIAVVAEQSHQGIPGGPVLLAEEPKQRSTSASHCWKTSPDRCQDSTWGIAVWWQALGGVCTGLLSRGVRKWVLSRKQRKWRKGVGGKGKTSHFWRLTVWHNVVVLQNSYDERRARWFIRGLLWQEDVYQVLCSTAAFDISAFGQLRGNRQAPGRCLAMVMRYTEGNLELLLCLCTKQKFHSLSLVILK